MYYKRGQIIYSKSDGIDDTLRWKGKMMVTKRKR